MDDIDQQSVDVLNATDNFYKLKNEYEIQKQNVLKKVKKMYLSKRIDLKGFKKYTRGIKFPCVNCKRNVNSLFMVKDYGLKAKCGDLEDPCRLNILINRSIYLPYDKIYNGDGIIEGLHSQIDKIKASIIDVKTKYILKIIPDIEVISLFDQYNETLQELLEDNALRKDIYLDLLNNEINTDKIQDKTNSKNVLIQDIKAKISEYKLSEYKDKDKIIEVIDIYLTSLIPTIDELNNLQYRVREMESMFLNKCVINYYDTAQTYFDAEKQSIMANDYGVRQVKRRDPSIDVDVDDDDEETMLNIGD